MHKPRSTFLLVAFLGVISLGWCWSIFSGDSHDFTNYKRVQVGMSIEEVQAILGPGSLVKQAELPTTIVAVNPNDAVAAQEKEKMSGGSPTTTRDYPVRHKPVVEGDYILRWVNNRTGERILVAFKDGKVCEKDFYDPNYL